jgi:hypothetical protein
MSPEEFRQQLCKHKRLTRELIVERGDPGCEPITKISGVPWWPAGLARPMCGVGHLMSFMAQVRLSDVPGFESQDETLISFHYCQQCAYDGNMSFGWDCCSNRSGYAVSVISEISSKKSDQLGAVAEVVIEPQAVTLLDVTEIPGYEETTNLFPETPDDYPQGEGDYDENIYPGVKHVSRSKLGGWP